MILVFVALIEVRPLPGCEIDPEEFNGVCVRCYIPAVDEAVARTLFMRTLNDSSFELMEEEFFVQENLIEWENPANDLAVESIAKAKATGEVVFSDFNGWGHDDPDAYPEKQF